MTRATLRDVAAHAGVSHQTVSNVLNDHPSIRPTTRQRVLDSIQALDYYPNQAAKALRESRITTLCCAFCDVEASEITDPYRNLIQAAFVAEANANGYSITTEILSSRSAEGLHPLRSAFLQQRFGGAVIIGAHLRPVHAQRLEQWGLPTVLFDHIIPGFELPSVTADYASGMKLLVDHLVERGRRRLALIIPVDDAGSTAVARREGFVRAAERHQLAHQVIGGDWSYHSGGRAFEELHRSGFAPDAVLGGNDRMAAGALSAARQLRLQVPQDVAISGFDDFEFAQYTAPTLTSVHVPYGKMAREAVGMLLGQIAGPRADAARVLPLRLSIRESA